nr:integrase, catalytic region, zinc finger, CCHC-type, peptidase aspartic, catalytic [Tanacetum cinerariifolium]
MLNKENYVLWSSRLLLYAKSRPNGNLIYNSIINGPYVRRMIPEPGDPNREVPMNETFHVQTDDELTKKELKQIKADDQAIQTILLDHYEDIYAAVDSCETTQEIWLRVQQMMKGSSIGIQEKKAKLFNEWERFTSTDGESIESYYHHFLKLMNDLKRNKHFAEKIASNLMNQNPNGNGNLVAARAEGNATGHNGNQIRCYNRRGLGHFARNCTVRPRRRDAAYLQTQLLIAQKEEAGIQLQAEEFDLMSVAADLDKIEEVNVNCILMANLQQASTSGNQTDKAPVYDSDGSVEVHNYEDFYDNEIFNMFTQEEQYTELLEPIPEPHQVPQNDNNVISDVSSVEQIGGTVEQHLTNVEEIHLNKQLSVEKSTVSSLLEEKKKLKSDFKIREDELLDKQIQLEKKIKELDNILVKTGQSIQMIHMRSPKPDSFYHTEQKMALGYQSPFYLKQAQQKQQSLYDVKVLFEKHDPPVVHDSKRHCNLFKRIERLQAQLGELKGKSKDTSCVSDTLNPLSQKLENENVELEFQDTSRGTSATTKFAKQLILGKPPKVGETHALSKPVTSNSIPTPQGSKVVKNVKVIAPGMFRINPFNPSREEKHVPNKVRASKQKANVSIQENQKKQKPKVKKPKKVGSIERLASPKPSKPRSFLRWSPTGRLFDLKGKFLGTVRFGNDHVAAILGFGDLQWGNILITRVYFVEGFRSQRVLGRAVLQGKSKRASHPPKPFPNSRQRLHLLHMNLYGPLRIASINGKRKPNISFLHVFGAICYPKNDRKDIGRLGAKGDIGFFIGYSADSCAYRIYNRRKKKIMVTMNVTFDELLAMAFEQRSSKPRLQSMTSGQISSGLDLTYAPSTITAQQPTKGELDLLFEAMYDDYIGGQPSTASRIVSAAQAHQIRQTPMTSTSIADTAPTPTNSSSHATNFSNSSQDVDGLNSQQQHAQQQGY